MADITGHKTGGRTLGTSRKLTVALPAALATPTGRVIDALTPEQVETMDPREVLMRAMRRALLEGILPLAAKIATDLMPYHYAKKTPVKEHDPDALRAEDIADDPDPTVKD